MGKSYPMSFPSSPMFFRNSTLKDKDKKEQSTQSLIQAMWMILMSGSSPTHAFTYAPRAPLRSSYISGDNFMLTRRAEGASETSFLHCEMASLGGCLLACLLSLAAFLALGLVALSASEDLECLLSTASPPNMEFQGRSDEEPGLLRLNRRYHCGRRQRCE